MDWLKQNWIKFVWLGILILGVVFVVYLGVFSFSNFFKRDCSKLVPKNPYPQATGEYAGFDWSMLDRGSRDCEAYNEPFIIGCMEYVKQKISYNQCLDNKSNVKYETIKPVLLKKCSNYIGEYCMDEW